MSDDRLFSLDEIPEVPLLRVPRGSRGAQISDERLGHDYPPEWDECLTCEGFGRLDGGMQRKRDYRRCPDCLGMGSVKARVRLEAGHRCVRCGHPYMPKGDAKMLGVKPSGVGGDHMGGRWSACDERCWHSGPLRMLTPEGPEIVEPQFSNADVRAAYDFAVEAEWRILTVHHLDGDKANLRWWNLAALCQRCHLEIQGRVVMERIYPHEHSVWFRPYVAGYYALVYLGEELDREQTMARLPELLDLERLA